MTGDWRDYRPTIWLTMTGVALILLVSPSYFGAVFLGFAIGAAIRTRQRRRRAAAARHKADRPQASRPKAPKA